MATFDIPDPKVAPGSLPGPRITPDHVAPVQGINALNQNIQATVDTYERRREADRLKVMRTRVDQVITTGMDQVSQKFYVGPEAYWSRKGEAAMGVYGEARGYMSTLGEDLRKSLSTQDEKDAFDSQWLPYQNRMLSSTGQREQGQLDVYNKSVNRAQDAANINYAANSVADPAGLKEADLRSSQLVDKMFANGEFVSQPEADKAKMDRFSANRVSAINRMAELDPTKAVELYFREEGRITNPEMREGLKPLVQKAIQNGTSARMRELYKEAEEIKPGSGVRAVRAAMDRQLRETERLPRTVVVTKQGTRVDLESAVRGTRVDPTTLEAVAFAESGGLNFDENATSKAGAVGTWQIMPGTAKEYGIDPRDPVASANGAARYLENMFDLFGEEDLRHSIAAYNAGPGGQDSGSKGVRGAMRKAGSLDYDDYEKFLPTETRNYVKKVMKRIEGGQAMPEWAKSATEDAANQEIQRSIALDNTRHMGVSDPNVVSNYRSILGLELLDPVTFAGRTDAELEQLYRTELPESLFNELLDARQKLKSTPNLKSALTVADSYIDSMGLFPTGGSDSKKAEVATQRYWFEEALYTTIQSKLRDKNGVELSRDEVMEAVSEVTAKTGFVASGIFNRKKIIPKPKFFAGRTEDTMDIENSLTAKPATKSEIVDAHDTLRRHNISLSHANVTDYIEGKRSKETQK